MASSTRTWPRWPGWRKTWPAWRVHKDDLIAGVGGEVLCDIAGFVASTYNRGMPLALFPTTLLAQADAAVGGKASLNLPQGRNLVGTVHQPVTVLADVAVAAEQQGPGVPGRPGRDRQARADQRRRPGPADRGPGPAS